MENISSVVMPFFNNYMTSLLNNACDQLVITCTLVTDKVSHASHVWIRKNQLIIIYNLDSGFCTVSIFHQFLLSLYILRLISSYNRHLSINLDHSHCILQSASLEACLFFPLQLYTNFRKSI